MIPLPSFGLSAGSENGIDDGWVGGRIGWMNGWMDIRSSYSREGTTVVDPRNWC